MRRSPRVWIAWGLAVIVAFGTARIVTSDLSSLHRRARTLGPDITVMVAARDLLLGTAITAADMRAITRPASVVARDAVRDVSFAVGRVVAVPMLRDDVVRAADLRADTDALVPPGRRAVHVIEKDGFRPPLGAVVDVLAAFDRGGPLRASVVAAGARVIAVDDGTSAGAESGAGVTLLVTEDEAAAIAYAASYGQLTIALAPPEAAR